jgi:peptide/nickel transport system permease protein
MASSIRASATNSPPLSNGVPAPLATPLSVKGESPWQRTWRQLRKHRLAMFGLGVLTVFILAAILAPLITPYDPDKVNLLQRLQPPSRTHWMGTDELGRDVYTRVLYGARVSLAIGFIVAILSTALGGLIGASSGYVGGTTDEATMRFVDVMRSLPTLPILIVLAQVLRLQFGIKGGVWNIILILIIFSWTGIARIIRGVILSLKNHDFVLAAESVGVPRTKIIGRHLLSNAFAPMIVAATLGAAAAINAESALSFLGLGIQPPTPSWGNLLFNAQTYLWTTPWVAIFPGLCIFITLLSINFLGDGLRDALDPRLQQG